MVVDVEVNAHPETAITILCRNSCTGHADAEHRPEVNRPVEPQPVISGVSAAKLVGNLQGPPSCRTVNASSALSSSSVLMVMRRSRR